MASTLLLCTYSFCKLEILQKIVMGFMGGKVGEGKGGGGGNGRCKI